MDAQNFQGWIAALSTGEHVVERQTQPGERTSWQQLLLFCRENNVAITGLRLFRGGIMVHSLPKKACDGYFHAYEAYRTLFGDLQALKQGIGSVIGDTIYITWITDRGLIYQDVRPLEQNRIHTTLSR